MMLLRACRPLAQPPPTRGHGRCGSDALGRSFHRRSGRRGGCAAARRHGGMPAFGAARWRRGSTCRRAAYFWALMPSSLMSAPHPCRNTATPARSAASQLVDASKRPMPLKQHASFFMPPALGLSRPGAARRFGFDASAYSYFPQKALDWLPAPDIIRRQSIASAPFARTCAYSFNAAFISGGGVGRNDYDNDDGFTRIAHTR